MRRSPPHLLVTTPESLYNLADQDPASAADLGRLDPEAIERVRREAWPEAESADELHDALLPGTGTSIRAKAIRSP